MREDVVEEEEEDEGCFGGKPCEGGELGYHF